MRRSKEAGLSDALGAIFLVAVVGAAVALAGVAILSKPTPEKIPALSADITTVGRNILITHNGGDPIQKADLAIIVDGIDMKDSFRRIDSTPWTTWAVGDSLLYQVPDGQPMPDGVTLFFIGASSPRIIESMGVPQSVSAGGLYATGPTPVTSSPTPTPTPTSAIPLPVLADFSANPTTGLVPLSTQFSDASTGPVTNRSWTFGDGGSSYLQNPLYQYTAAGTYSVSLIVSNGSGTSTLTKTNYITVTQYAPGLLANYFNDQSWSVPAITKTASRIRYADTASGYVSDLANWPLDYIGKTDHFSVSFDGYLYVPANDTYTFYLTSDDGSYLSLDGVQVIDNGGDHSPQMQQVTRNLTAGYHPVQVRMYENGGGAVVHLEYSTPTVARTFVTDLYHIPTTPPFSDFTGTPRVGSAPLAVQFTDTSVDASGWTWDFGDGSPASNAQNPLHTYTVGGSYNVTLTTTNGIGSNTVRKDNYIVMGSLDPGFAASYYYDQGWASLAGTRVDNLIRFADDQGDALYATDEVNWPTSMVGGMEDFSVSWDGFLSVPAGDTYTFYLTSDDGSWLWIDGVMVIDNGGLHAPQERSGSVVLTAGYHEIRVRMFENTGNAVAHLEYSTPTVARTFVTDVSHVPMTPVTPAPVAGFTGTPVSGNAPLTVAFSDTSTGSPTSWSWNFGDSGTSTLQNPSHQYTSAGTYTVSLTATNAGGSNTATRTNYIVVSPAPVTAGFTGTPTSGNRPLAVQFTDASTGPVTSWAWTFGDGNTSTLQSPLYTYPNGGTYSPSLTVSNGTGTNTLTRTNYITATLPSPQTIFSDNFDAGLSGWSTSGNAISFTGTPHNGVAGIQVNNTGQMQRTISTAGYSNITVSLNMGANSLEGSDTVYLEWSPDGSSWSALDQIVNGDPEEDDALHPFTYTLPATANNQAAFALRFRIAANSNNDQGHLDDVVVSGIPL